MNIAIDLVVVVTGIKVPRNIWGNIKINESPVAVPEDLDIVAIISPNPTELSENTIIKRKAKTIPIALVFGVNPNGIAKIYMIITCRTTIIIFDNISLAIKSADVIGVMFNLLRSP